MQDPANELRRIPLPRTWVNKGKKEGRSAAAPALPRSVPAQGGKRSRALRGATSLPRWPYGTLVVVALGPQSGSLPTVSGVLRVPSRFIL